jgi:hypothetical protein
MLLICFSKYQLPKCRTKYCRTFFTFHPKMFPIIMMMMATPVWGSLRCCGSSSGKYERKEGDEELEQWFSTFVFEICVTFTVFLVEKHFFKFGCVLNWTNRCDSLTNRYFYLLWKLTGLVFWFRTGFAKIKS